MTQIHSELAQKQLKIVLEASLLSDTDLERYLDRLGIEPTVLDQWLDAAINEVERTEIDLGLSKEHCLNI